MNIDQIFNMFEKDNKDVDENNMLIDFSDHPLYWISGFNKIVNNYVLFTEYINREFNNIQPELRSDDLGLINNIILYNRAWEYIKRFNIDNKFHLDCLKLKASNSLLKSLESSVLIFEGMEEYEKCAFLKKIQDKVKEYLI